jgi:hypothetical protein
VGPTLISLTYPLRYFSLSLLLALPCFLRLSSPLSYSTAAVSCCSSSSVAASGEPSRCQPLMVLSGHSLFSTSWLREGSLRRGGQAVWGQARGMRQVSWHGAGSRRAAAQLVSGRRGKPAACSVQRAVARRASWHRGRPVACGMRRASCMEATRGGRAGTGASPQRAAQGSSGGFTPAWSG